MTKYSIERYVRLQQDTFNRMHELATKKGGEYSGDDDRLANFRRNAEALGVNKETIWAVYAAKHWDALMQFIKDKQAGKSRERLEPIEGRIDDLLVYLMLMKAMLDEEGMATSTEEKYGASVDNTELLQRFMLGDTLTDEEFKRATGRDKK